MSNFYREYIKIQKLNNENDEKLWNEYKIFVYFRAYIQYYCAGGWVESDTYVMYYYIMSWDIVDIYIHT